MNELPEQVERFLAGRRFAVAGGCPLMYVAPVDIGHRCMRWWLARGGRVPG